jgi:hypothetical protein
MRVGNPSITILFSDASDGCVNGKQVNAMDVKDAMNRGNNLLMTGFLAVLGFGLIPEILRETEWMDRGLRPVPFREQPAPEVSRPVWAGHRGIDHQMRRSRDRNQ